MQHLELMDIFTCQSNNDPRTVLTIAKLKLNFSRLARKCYLALKMLLMINSHERKSLSYKHQLRRPNGNREQHKSRSDR